MTTYRPIPMVDSIGRIVEMEHINMVLLLMNPIMNVLDTLGISFLIITVIVIIDAIVEAVAEVMHYKLSSIFNNSRLI